MNIVLKRGGVILGEKDIAKRLIKSNALFKMIHVTLRRYDILPSNKKHIGAYIEYQDIKELRDDFLDELADSIVDWIYSSEKFSELKKIAMKIFILSPLF